MSKVLGRDKEFIRVISKDTLFLLPDSVFEDTTLEEEYAFGDTVSIIPDGMDTMFVLYEDTTAVDSLAEELRTYDITKDIKVNIGGTTNTINNGLLGIAIEGIFAKGKIPEGDAYNPNAWNWISQLCPKSIRFPGGASDRWVHLLPFDRDGDDLDDPIKGYGYDIYEIIRFYDITDGVIDAADPLFVEYIIDEMILNDGECLGYQNWMKYLTDGIDPEVTTLYKKQFEDLYKKWSDEQLLDEEDPNVMYIDQFVHLIKKIQDENPGHVVDVILDLNIMSESASQNKKIVQYLRDGSEDGNNYGVDVNVVGVEMGNEMYFDWAVLMMGFNTFNNYWNYINGANPNTAWTTAFYGYIFQGDIATDHDYIQTFKGDPLFECKVGLPADNLPYGSDFVFRETGDYTHTTDWNASLSHSSKYNATINTGTIIRYKFDAIILHPYYESDKNWEDIMLDNLWDKYPETAGVWHACSDETTEQWQYGSTDIRLRDAYWKLLGTSAFSPSGSFRNLIKQKYIESYNEQNARFKFYLTTANRKELWTTEWNIKDIHPTLSSTDQAVVSSCTNSFAHGLLIQEWWLKNLKLNFNASYRENFFTYSHIHGFSGGAARSLLFNADNGDFVNHIPTLNPADYTGQTHWLRRTTYYIMDMLGEISKNNLRYLPSNTFMYLSNPNIQPTVFIDNDHSYLYVYFSNMKDATQSYIVNPHHLINLFPEGTAVGFENATLYYVEADQPYSSSGKNDLFKINTCYTATNLHPFEIQGITGPIENIPEVTDGIPSGAICVTVPRITVGYFKIPIQAVELKTEVSTIEQLIKIYPNPSGDFFKVGSEVPGILKGELEITVHTISGAKTKQLLANENEQIDISNLPNGIYLVKIKAANNITVTKRLIKTN